MASRANMNHRLNYLTNRILRLEKLLATAPAGTLYIRKRKGKTCIYTRSERSPGQPPKETYLHLDDPQLRLLADKRLAELELADLQKEKTLIETILRYQNIERQADRYLKAHPEILDLLSAGMKPFGQLAQEWMTEPYIHNQKYPESLKYPTILPDLMVRSKAEADLVSRFVHYKVPFRYEEVISINGEDLAPDFKLLNVRSGRIFYWDHRGLSDDPGYLQKIHYCERLYQQVQIIPWNNLIITTETREAPLDIPWVDELIEYWLL